MSSPPQGRALTFPVAWRRSQQHCNSAAKPAGERSPSDEEVMARLQSEGSAALQVLFARYGRMVFALAKGILRDRGEAEDIVQDAFFYVYQKSMLFDASKGSAKNWIMQIALHRALDRKSHLVRRGFYVGTDIDAHGDTLLGETDLDREIGAKLNRAHLERAFAQLPEIQRLTLALFYFEGWDLHEISEKLNQPLGNCRHHFYRGLERLRKSAFVQRLRGSK